MLVSANLPKRLQQCGSKSRYSMLLLKQYRLTAVAKYSPRRKSNIPARGQSAAVLPAPLSALRSRAVSCATRTALPQHRNPTAPHGTRLQDSHCSRSKFSRMPGVASPPLRAEHDSQHLGKHPNAATLRCAELPERNHSGRFHKYHMYIYIYIYISVRVCVYVCMCIYI